MRPLSRQDTYARIARAARLGCRGDDPEGAIASFAAWVADGCRGSLDDALGLSETVPRIERLARRDKFIRQFFTGFDHLSEQDQVGGAYRLLKRYWEEEWSAKRFIEGGGHEPDSVKHLCWLIFDAEPRLMKQRQFARIVGRK